MTTRSPDTAAPTQAPPPDFLNPWNCRPLIRYFEAIGDWHGYIRFLGLPHLRDNPDVPIQNLYVEPAISDSYIRPDLPLDKWPRSLSSIEDALVSERRVVLLGEPGSGKSTLVSWLACQLSRPEESVSTMRLGPLVPFPITLRDLRIDDTITWDSLLDRFLSHPMAQALQSERTLVEDLLTRGQALLMLDGLDEVGSISARQALRKAVLDGIARHPHSYWLLTSRIVGYEVASFGIVPLGELPPNWFCALPGSPLHAFGGRIADAFPISSGEAKLADLTTASPAECGPLTHLFYWPGARMQTSLPALRYLAPFNDDQIRRFAFVWHYQHETIKDLREQRALNFVAAIHHHDATLRLARVPNLLTMMALIHRVLAELPHGRANLYNDIAHAYLQSIDQYRGLREYEYSLEEKKSWLAKVGYEMQLRRAQAVGRPKEDKTERDAQQEFQEILVPESDVVTWVIAAMADMGHNSPSAEAEARQFVDHIARRSGLLIPRAEAQFAFVHLSFQEYFAACYLLDQVMAPRWLPVYTDNQPDAQPEDADTHEPPTPVPDQPPASASDLPSFSSLPSLSSFSLTPETLATFANKPLWRETFCLLFELLPRRRDWPHQLADWLFGRDDCRRLFHNGRANDEALNMVVLLAALAGDPYTGFSHERRHAAMTACWQWELLEQQRYPDTQREAIKNLLNPLESPSQERGVSRLCAFQVALHAVNPKRLSLYPCPDLTDLSLLTGLESLEALDLAGCTRVADFDPLASLASLQYLNLSGSSQLTDIFFLRSLQSLVDLRIAGCTRIADISPLDVLVSLANLDLSSTNADDLSPLRRLSQLQYLRVCACPRLSDLTPLSSLTDLRHLDLSGCHRVRDLAPLTPMNNLRVLAILGGAAIADLSPLTQLHNLNELFLGGPLATHDLMPLDGLTTLRRLYLTSFRDEPLRLPLFERLKNLRRLDVQSCITVSDLSPLQGLHELHELTLSDCIGIVDISPLGRLARLQRLDLDGCLGITDISTLGSFSSLRFLSLSGCTGVTDLSPLKHLTSLRCLNLSGCTGLTNLSPLESLINLEFLYLSGCTGVTDRSPLRALTDLRVLA